MKIIAWFAALSGKLSGYRTLFFLAVSIILKLLAITGVLHGTSVDANEATDKVILIVSGLCDFAAFIYRTISTKPGPMAPPYVGPNRRVEISGDAPTTVSIVPEHSVVTTTPPDIVAGTQVLVEKKEE